MGQLLDKYLILRGVMNKKYYPAYALAAMEAWKDIFQNTIYVQASSWQEIKREGDRLYIDVPRGIVRFFAVNTLDDCGLLVPLYYNSQINVIDRPTSSCSCESCGCDSGLCEDANSMTLTTKVLFVINGVEYIEKKWTKYCKNGDVIEYTETPVKKYNDRIGTSGDFNIDYNDDYDIGSSGFQNFDIVYVNSQKVLCKLKTKECGCPEDTEENKKCFYDACGSYLNHCCDKKKCYPIFCDINSNKYGEVKFGECGTKIYFRPQKNWWHKQTKPPTHLQVSYQVSGESYNSEVVIPEGATRCLYAGIDYFTKVYNNKYLQQDKKIAEYKYEDEKIKLIGFMNPISFDFLKNVSDAVIRW